MVIDAASETNILPGDSSAPSGNGEHKAQENGDQNEYSVCLGRYEDNIIDGILQKEWVQCTNTSTFGLWMHSDCLSTEGSSYVCFMCNKTLK